MVTFMVVSDVAAHSSTAVQEGIVSYSPMYQEIAWVYLRYVNVLCGIQGCLCMFANLTSTRL